jgi:hypothetical protein
LETMESIQKVLFWITKLLAPGRPFRALVSDVSTAVGFEATVR